MSDMAGLLSDLQRPWRHGEHVDGRGLVLEETLVLDGLVVRGFDLSGAELRGGLSAQGTVFCGLAWLRGASVSGRCDFKDARFRTDLRCDRLVAGFVDLSGCYLDGVLSLAGARVDGLSLNGAVVMANVTLEDAVVRDPVKMDGAEVLGGLWTRGASISGTVGAGAEISGRF